MKNLISDVDIYCINLKRRPDRKIQMARQFKNLGLIKNVVFIEAVDSLEINEENTIKNTSSAESACIYSHIKAMKEFIKTKKEYCLILEDDSNIENSLLFQKNIISIIIEKRLSDFALQLQPIVRTESSISPFISERVFWHFGTGAYLISREYAKKVVNFLGSKKAVDTNFKSKLVTDPRNGQVFKTRPSVEEVIFYFDNVYTLPIFKTIIGHSDLSHGHRTEAILQEKHSNQCIDDILSIVIDGI